LNAPNIKNNKEREILITTVILPVHNCVHASKYYTECFGTMYGRSRKKQENKWNSLFSIINSTMKTRQGKVKFEKLA
jgi:hypothetical protein